jgi:hypothetical protein
MRSFRPRFKGLVVEMDASLSGIGLLLYDRDETGREVVVGAAAMSLEEFNFGEDSAWQNAAEFIGATVGLAMALGLGLRDQTVEVRGDSVTALTWADTQRFRGWRASNAAVVFALVASAGRLDCVGSHIDAAANWRTDTLSRRDKWGAGRSLREVVDTLGPEYAAAPVFDLEASPRLRALRDLCRPSEPAAATEEAFATLWSRTSAAVRGLAATGLPDQPRPASRGAAGKPSPVPALPAH